MKRSKWTIVLLLSAVLGCGASTGEQTNEPIGEQAPAPIALGTQTKQPETEKEKETPSLAELRRRFPETFIFNGPTDAKVVALTFDDAPDNTFTPLVLDALKEAGVQATFFVVGQRVEKYPEVMRRIVQEGHVVGNHSYSHANLPKLSDADFRSQITRTDELIRQYTGYVPSYIRPPYGNINEEQLKWFAGQHRKVVNWNVDSLDWKGLTKDEVAANILDHVKPGAIILQHSGGGVGAELTGTVEALPIVIAKLREQGYRMTTIPRLLGEH